MSDQTTAATQPDTDATADSVHHLEAQRRAKRDGIAALGLEPYGSRIDDRVSMRDAKDIYNEAADEAHKAAGKEPPADYADERPVITVAGRIVLARDNGKLAWLNLRDDTGDLQIAVSKRDCDELGFSFVKLCDLGDLVIATGPVMRTKTGEVTIWATSLRPAAKSLTQPPEKWAGMTDVDLRYRKRYMDMWSSPDSMRVFKLRSALVGRIRSFLAERDYLEVDTPMLQTQAGGAAARPFNTHMNALDLDLSLRIAPELFLKRLLVGGMPRVFEIARNFRNEGVSPRHNPEFTSVEIYEAFGDAMTMLELTESMIRELAKVAAADRAAHDETASADDLVLPFGDLNIDYGAAFDRVTFAELFERVLGFAPTDFDRARAEAQSRGFKVAAEDGTPLDGWLIVNELFEEVAEPTIDPARPTFVMEYPSALSPLTRPKRDDPQFAERWDIFVGGMEIGPSYTELNDPDIQAEKFREQLAGVDDEESTFRTFDEDFVEALKVGMPPAGGLGLGVDRLIMLLGNQRSIRDVLLFPMMRPLGGDAPVESTDT